MHWYLVHTKPKQETCALYNLVRQGFQCYLPTFRVEKVCQGVPAVVEEPLFPRYLFVRLGAEASGKGWGPIRSTRGVSRLVTFGSAPARLSDGLIAHIRTQEEATQKHPAPLFKPGDRVRLTGAPFNGLEGIYQMADGKRRVMVLIELMSRPVTVTAPLISLRGTG